MGTFTVGFFECMCAKLLQSCLTLCNLKDCSLPGSSVCGISQAGILEWVAISFSRGSSWLRDWICRQILYHWATRLHYQSQTRKIFITHAASFSLSHVLSFLLPDFSPQHSYLHCLGWGHLWLVTSTFPKLQVTVRVHLTWYLSSGEWTFRL